MDCSSDFASNQGTVRSPSKRKRNDSVSISSTPADLYTQQDITSELDARLQDHVVTSGRNDHNATANGNALPSTPPNQIIVSDHNSGVPGSASPRTKVANQLEHLEIKADYTLTSPPQSKKARIGRSDTNQPPNPPEDFEVSKSDELSENPESGGPVKPLPWLKTRQALIPGSSERPPGTTTKTEAPGFLITSPSMEQNSKTLPDEGSNFSNTDGLQVPEVVPFTFTSPRITPRSLSPTPDQESQFWSLSEITGHDPNDPDDDGTGINGVGFKPTAAMAAARSTKRKQQVEGWRKREAEDARRRRAEIRSGALLTSGMRRAESRERANAHPMEKVQAQESPARRMVRFAT